MERNELRRALGSFRSATLLTILFLITFAVIYVLHVRLFKVDVVLYSAIGDSLLAVLACTVVVLAWRTRLDLSILESVQLIAIWCLLGFSIAIAVPTVIDRSLSFYLLEKVQQKGGGISLDRFSRIFVDEYVREHRLVEVRLTEQVASGTLLVQGDCVYLTKWGGFLAQASSAFRRELLPRNRLLLSRYTDELTRLGESIVVGTGECQRDLAEISKAGSCCFRDRRLIN